ncbi:MAG: HAD-IB family hydrolase [Candidatus Levybacteria bacterium CG10_big_fil_rev_8_21_14_0_10_35_13]|nr:MAG: HAD-IB family hydrolase [Candidatus Levybacteria bacterium CG10_big_fil_rev_8_21_14_0_10_35_13]
MKKYAFFDVDNTIYNGYLTSSFTNYMAENKLISRSHQKENLKLQIDYEKGNISYNDSIIKIISLQAQSLKNKNVSEVKKVVKDFLSQNQKIFPYVKNLFSYLSRKGFVIYLISGATKPLIESMGSFLKVYNIFASELEIKETVYTGKVLNFQNAENKRKTILNLIKEKSTADTILSFGDSVGDIEMLRLADHAFVINPHQKEMIDLAKKENWFLVNEKNIFSEVIKALKPTINPYTTDFNP